MQTRIHYGSVAIVSLSAGVLGAKFASIAGTGVAAELRSAEMKKIQLSHLRTSITSQMLPLITRMTSDVNNIQTIHCDDAYFARAPMMFYLRDFLCGKYQCAIITCLHGCSSILMLSLALIISTAFPRFRKTTTSNRRHQPYLTRKLYRNSRCKSFVRETFEKKKFGKENSTFRERAFTCDVCRNIGTTQSCN